MVKVRSVSASEPLISIITSTYNRAHLLPRAINSVLNQSYHNFEMIIVDDGSCDNTEVVVRTFGDTRIHYHKHAQNRGMLAARNTGFDLANGEYIAILDDDDELLPEALKIVVNKLAELSSTGVKIVFCDRVDFERNQRSGWGIEKEGYVNYDDLLCERVFGDFFLVIARDLLGKEERFDERLWGEEVILWLKLLRKTKAFYVPEVVYRNYREHGERVCDFGNRVKNLDRGILTHKVFLEQYGEELKRLCPKLYGRRVGFMGSSQIMNGDKLEGRKACRESFKYNLSLEIYIVYVLSFIIGASQIKRLALKYTKVLNIRRYLLRIPRRIPRR